MEKRLDKELLTDEELKRKLASGEYSISPHSGRLRKRIRVKGKRPPYSKRKLKKLTRKILWILLVAGFLITLMIIGPELNVSPKKTNTKNMKR